jgi:hypothetical protein
MRFVPIVLAFAAVAGAADNRPAISECFKVRSMIRADQEHYWAAWTNTCSYTIDTVYVMVSFADRSNNTVGDGVWGLHFITPGASRVTRFSTPLKVSDFHSVTLRKITTDLWEAFSIRSR